MRIEDGLQALQELLEDNRPSMCTHTTIEGMAIIREMRARFRNHQFKVKLNQCHEVSTFLICQSNPSHDLWPAHQEIHELVTDLKNDIGNF